MWITLGFHFPPMMFMQKPTGQLPGIKSFVFRTFVFSIGLLFWPIHKIYVYVDFVVKGNTFVRIEIKTEK